MSRVRRRSFFLVGIIVHSILASRSLDYSLLISSLPLLSRNLDLYPPHFSPPGTEEGSASGNCRGPIGCFGLTRKRSNLDDCTTNPHHVSLCPQICWYCHFVDTPSDSALTLWFWNEISWKYGSEGDLKAVDLSRYRRSVPTFPFSEALFPSHPPRTLHWT